MKSAKKMSRKLKEEMCRDGICWKCGEKTVETKKGKTACKNGCFTYTKI